MAAGDVPLTSSSALENNILPYLQLIASGDIKDVLRQNQSILDGLQLYLGKLTSQSVSESLKLDFTDPMSLL